jgi:membrane-associated phospholipid phosphatase
VVVRARLTRAGFLGLQLTLSIIVLIVATWLFAAIAEDVVTGDRITIVDARFSEWLHTHGNATLTRFMLWISEAHAMLPVLVATAGACSYLWIRRLRLWVLTLVISVVGGSLLNVLLKLIFHRPRPYFGNPILLLKTYSFPSGHTLMATVFYGTLCALVVSRTKNWKWRALAAVGAMTLIALVGFSRIYLGAHYLTDVLAAILEGVTWVTLSVVAVRLELVPGMGS